MTTTLGRLFLDIDGVINAPRAAEYWDRVADARVEAEGEGYFDIVFAPQVVERIEALRDRIEVVWCSTWLFHPAHLDALSEALCGLAHARRPEVPDLIWRSFGWKGGVVRDLTKSDPLPFAWVDDTEGLWRNHAWVLSREIGLRDPLILNPDELGGAGITPAYLEALESCACAL